ncbi:MAG TPA: hypothetical protein VME22_11370 [Solirubrobacteraceae bacterium]|nr:hypothetical protein [Solirubrobacteraceae bacterium]
MNLQTSARHKGVVHQAEQAATNVERRNAAAEQRRQTAVDRISELQADRVHPAHRVTEAIARLAKATAAAQQAHKLALQEYEHAAAAHDDAARAHERAADLIAARGDKSRALFHQHEATRARAAASDARRVAAAHSASFESCGRVPDTIRSNHGGHSAG